MNELNAIIGVSKIIINFFNPIQEYKPYLWCTFSTVGLANLYLSQFLYFLISKHTDVTVTKIPSSCNHLHISVTLI